MPATPLPKATRFFQPETSKCWFLPAIASASLAYTLAERDAGTDLTGEIADLAGWSVSTAMINTPDMATKFVGQIGGRINADASSITFYGDKAGLNDIRDVLPRGTTGYVVWADGGDVAGQPSDVFPIEVTSVSKIRSAGDQAFQITISFAITRQPGEDVAIPAA